MRSLTLEAMRVSSTPVDPHMMGSFDAPSMSSACATKPVATVVDPSLALKLAGEKEVRVAARIVPAMRKLRQRRFDATLTLFQWPCKDQRADFEQFLFRARLRPLQRRQITGRFIQQGSNLRQYHLKLARLQTKLVGPAIVQQQGWRASGQLGRQSLQQLLA